MKLATLKDRRGRSRDGRLVVVSKDLTRSTDASRVAPNLQAALDDWAHTEPHLRLIAESLENHAVPDERFHEHDALSPLPRAYQWVDASGYLNHVELVRKARSAEMTDDMRATPLMYQGGSDSFLSPRDPIPHADEVLRHRFRSGSGCYY